MALPDYRIRAERERVLWNCLVQHKQQSIGDGHKRQNTGQYTQITFTRRNMTNLPPTPTDHRESEQERDYRLEVKKYRVEVLTLIFIVIYTGLTYLLFRLTRQNMDLTQEAFIHVEPNSIGADAHFGGDDQTAILSVGMRNEGLTVARGVSGTVNWCIDKRRSLPQD